MSWRGTHATATGFAALRVYITPHFRKCSPVAALKLRLVSPTASRPNGFPKQALCTVAFASSGRVSRRRSSVAFAPYAPPPVRPCDCGGTWVLVRRCARCCWSVACGQSCGVCPRPPLCFAAARHQPCALVCPSAPRGGSLSPRACFVGFATGFVAGSARDTGATGLTACSPAYQSALNILKK